MIYSTKTRCDSLFTIWITCVWSTEVYLFVNTEILIKYTDYYLRVIYWPCHKWVQTTYLRSDGSNELSTLNSNQTHLIEELYGLGRLWPIPLIPCHVVSNCPIVLRIVTPRFTPRFAQALQVVWFYACKMNNERGQPWFRRIYWLDTFVIFECLTICLGKVEFFYQTNIVCIRILRQNRHKSKLTYSKLT